MAVGITVIAAIVVVVCLRKRSSNKVMDEDSSFVPSVSDNAIKQSSPDKTLKVENITEEDINNGFDIDN